MKYTILCGISGSGKSTIAKELDGAIYSADDFFMNEGEYKFDARCLLAAHAQCFRAAVSAAQHGVEHIIIDNTNTTIAEIAPYAAMAIAYGYKLIIRTIPCSVDVAFERNIHGVPRDVIAAQSCRLDTLEIPTYWKR